MTVLARPARVNAYALERLHAEMRVRIPFPFVGGERMEAHRM